MVCTSRLVSSLWLNWRFGGWFFQWDRRWYRPVGVLRQTRNPGDWQWGFWRLSRVPGRPAQGEGLVEIYQGRVQFALVLLAIVVAILWGAS